MKLAVSERSIERFAVPQERSFQIKATGKAFRILSSGLYKDKILAIVREISCNAYDAHVAAGCPDRPFAVHLPNGLEPFFSVRDFGPGLSDEDINTIYTTYFESTKSNSNDFIGALGLGSKSPFSYVDSFTVISRHGGMKRTYTAFIAEDDMPSLVQMVEEPTVEETGLEVVIPVLRGNDYQFVQAAQKVYVYFDVPPLITGHANFSTTKQEVLFEGDGWVLRNLSIYEKPIARMGMVAYPIDRNAMGSVSTWSDWITHPFEVRFPIGSLDVTAGREELSYDKATTAAIMKRFEEIGAEFPKCVQSRFDECKTYYEAQIVYGQMAKAYGELVRRSKPKYKGKQIDQHIYIKLPDYPTLTLLEYYASPYERTIATSRAHTYRPELKHPQSISIVGEANLTIFYDDIGKKNQLGPRIRAFREENRHHEVYVVQTADEAELAKFTEALQGVPMKLLSTVEKPQSEPRAPVKAKMLCDYGFNTLNLSRDNFWQSDVDPAEGGVFLRTVSGVITLPGDSKEKSEHIHNIFAAAMEAKLIDKTLKLYAIPKSIEDKFSPDDGWQDFHVFLQREIMNKLADPVFFKQVSAASSQQAFIDAHCKVYGRRDILRSLGWRLPDDHPVRIVSDVASAEPTLNSFVRLIKFLEIPFIPDQEVDATKLWSEINTKYPMLEPTIRSQCEDMKPVVIAMAQYIKLIDNIASD